MLLLLRCRNARPFCRPFPRMQFNALAALARMCKALKSVKREDLLERVQTALGSWGGSLDFIAQLFHGGEWRCGRRVTGASGQADTECASSLRFLCYAARVDYIAAEARSMLPPELKYRTLTACPLTGFVVKRAATATSAADEVRRSPGGEQHSARVTAAS